MKYLSLGISILALIIVIAYVNFDNNRKSYPLQLYKQTKGKQEKRDYLNAKTIPLPEKLYFAGEEVPLERPEVRERLYRELLVNTYWHSNTLLMMAQANRWLPAIEKILIAEDVPVDFKYIPVIEGSLRNDVSYAGAVGFWQLLEGAAKENGLEIRDQVDERYHPLKSTEAAAKYIKRAYRKFESWTEVAASYNRGVAGLSRAMDKQKTRSYYDLYLNDETTRYIFRVLAMKLILENPEKYGFVVDDDHLFKPLEVKSMTIEESITDLPAFAKDLGITYGILRYYNPWLREYSLYVPSGKSYEFLLPPMAQF